MFVCFFQFSYFNRWKSLYVLIKTIKLNKKMLLTINTTRIGQMKSHNFITLVTTIRTCVGLPLFSCPGPPDDSAEAITTIALPSAPKWTPGEVCCSLRPCLVKDSYPLTLQHPLLEVQTSTCSEFNFSLCPPNPLLTRGETRVSIPP